MKPQLVNLNEIFKDNSSIFLKSKRVKEIVIPKKIIDTPTSFNYNSLFNLLGLIILIIGVYFLHKRKKEKEERKNGLQKRIYKLKDIIETNNEFIL